MDSNVARITPHNLDEENSVVRTGRVPDAVDGVQCRVDSRIKANGVIGTIEVVVDGTRRTHNRNIELPLQNHSSGEGTVPSDSDQPLDSVAL